MSDDSKKYRLKNTLSLSSAVNQLSPSSSSKAEVHPAEVVLQDIIDHVLWIEGGQYDGSDSTCVSNTPRSQSILPDEAKKVDMRLIYWKNFLERNDKVGKRLARRTGKDYSQLVMNITTEHRRIQLVKRILDFAERLRPEKLVTRRERRIELETPCAESLYETLPATEKTGVPTLTIVDVPKMILEELNLQNDTLSKWSWLKSKYLADRLFCKADDIRRVLSHYPDFENLSVLGKKEKDDVKEEELLESTLIEHSNYFLDFQVTEADIEEIENTHEYVVTVNEHELNVESMRAQNLEFHIICESQQYEKKDTVMLHLRNCGWKAVDFYWVCENPKPSKFIHAESQRLPAFYFDKNNFRLIPGQILEYPLIFCTKKRGIYNERWFLSTEPSFFLLGFSIIINLFGHCSEEEINVKLFNKINEDLLDRAARNMTINLLNIVAVQAIPEPASKAPYIQHFTEKEIFTCLYPGINFNQAFLDELKNLYREANLAISCRCCPEWNYDLDALKKQILSIDNVEKRKQLYFQLINIIRKLKRVPMQCKSIYEEQKFLLVKSVIIATLDKIDNLAENLQEQMLKTNLPLEFDEVLILDRQRNPPAMTFTAPPNSEEDDELINAINIEEDEMEEHYADSMKLPDEESRRSTNSSVNPASVVKSEAIRKKQKQLFMDSLYMQVFAHLGNAAEEIAGVIEGVKNLF